MRHVVFARPDHLDRRTHGLRSFDGGGNEVDVETPAKAAAEQRREDPHLLRLEPRRGGRRGLRHLLNLRAHVQVAAAGFDVGGAIHGFHGGMRQQRQVIGRARAFLCRLERAVGVAVGSRREPRPLGRRFLQHRENGGIVEAGVGARVPGDRKGRAGFHGLPVVLGHHEHAARGQEHLADTGHFIRTARIHRLHLAAEHRTLSEGRVQHAGQLHVESKFRAAVQLSRGVDAGERRADDFETALGLQLHGLGCRQLRRCVSHLAVGQYLARRSDHGPVLDPALRRIDPPTLRRRRDQHRARGGSGRTQLLPRLLHAVAGAGDLSAVAGTDIRVPHRRRHDADGIDVDLQLLGQQHGKGRVHALAHLGTIDDEGDGVVARDFEPRIHRRARQRCSVHGAGDRPPGQGARLAGTGKRQRQHQASAGDGRVQEVAARVCGGHAHLRTPGPSSSAARWMALRILGYVPQRQILPDIAASMSPSFGFGFVLSNAAADMICPDWQ